MPMVRSTQGRGKIYDSIIDTVGDTPLVRINRMSEGCVGEIYAKCEFFNPLSSVKDRIALSMVEAAEASGVLTKDSIVVEPTSGNTGIGLAFVCAAKGYTLILTMPESMSLERRKMLKLLGAHLVLTPASGGMKGAIAEAEKIVEGNPKALMLQQFQNPANPEIHRHTTAEEIWNDTQGMVDVCIAGVGTGGTLTGVGSALKQKKPSLKMIAVEPDASPILSGGAPGPHKIQGIGAGFVPQNLDVQWMDEVIRITNTVAFETARTAAKREGLPIGISSGAALAAALLVARRPEMEAKKIVVILASGAERYLSTDLFAGFDA